MEKINVNLIYEFDNRNDFKDSVVNRELNQGHVKKIKKAILEGTDVGEITIDVNTMQIADGHHRVAAYELAWAEGCKAKMRVIFKYINDINSYIFATNNSQKKWTLKDLVHFSKAIGNDNLKQLEDFCVGKRLLHNQTKNGKVTYYYKLAGAIVKGKFCGGYITNGTFEATIEEYEEANRTYREIEKLLETTGIARDFEAFNVAWCTIRRTHRYYSLHEKPGVRFSLFLEKAKDCLDTTSSTAYNTWYDRFDDVLKECEKEITRAKILSNQ